MVHLAYVPGVIGLQFSFKTVKFPNRSLLARVWSEVLWGETQCWEFWFPLCFGGLLVFLLFYWEENLKVAEAAYCSLSVWEGGSVCSIAKTLDSLDSRKSLDLTVLSDLTCPPNLIIYALKNLLPESERGS